MTRTDLGYMCPVSDLDPHTIMLCRHVLVAKFVGSCTWLSPHIFSRSRRPRIDNARIQLKVVFLVARSHRRHRFR